MGGAFRPQPAHPVLVAEMPGGTKPRRFGTGQPVSPFLNLGYHEATSKYAFSGKSAEPDFGKKSRGLFEERAAVCRFKGLGFMKFSRRKTTLNGELGTGERIQFTTGPALPDRKLFQESSFPHNRPGPDSFFPTPDDIPE